MSDFKTIGEYFEKRKKVEIVLRAIFILALTVMTLLIVFSAIMKKTNLFVTWIMLLFPVAAFSFVYLDKYIPYISNRKWLKSIGCENIADNMLISDPISAKSKIYCGTNIIFAAKFGVIIPYEQIAWVYVFNRKLYGINIESSLIVHTKTGKKIPVYAKERDCETIIFTYLLKRCPDLILGYGKEQKERYVKLKEISKIR